MPHIYQSRIAANLKSSAKESMFPYEEAGNSWLPTGARLRESFSHQTPINLRTRFAGLSRHQSLKRKLFTHFLGLVWIDSFVDGFSMDFRFGDVFLLFGLDPR